MIHILISLAISAAIVLFWYIIARVFTNLVNESMGWLALFFAKESPSPILYVVAWPILAAFHYFVPAFWFWIVIAVATLLPLVKLFFKQ